MPRVTTSKYPELQGLKGLEYRKAWNKLHAERMREVGRKCRAKPGYYKAYGERFRRRYGTCHTSHRNNATIAKASLRFQRWDPISDDLIMRGEDQGGQWVYEHGDGSLATMLGRTIRGIMARRRRLRRGETGGPE
jgi:hypothetical protein